MSLVTACSGQNREGPLVTCADLGNGASNACEQGIIATCSGGEVRYRVCDDENACDESWQTAGRYRCEQTDNLPVGGGSAGSGGDVAGMGGDPAGTGGASGSSGVGGVSGGSGTGGIGGTSGTGAAGDGGGSACGLDETCVIATTDSGYGIRALALDGENVYFVDGCGAVKKVPKLGGFVTGIEGPESGSACVNTPASLAATNSQLFVASPADGTLRVINVSDNSREQSYPGVSSGIAADNDAAYWGRAQDLQRYISASEMLETFSTGQFVGAGLAVGAIDVYWLSGTDLMKVAKNAGTADVPSSVALGPSGATEIAVDGSVVYFADTSGGKLGKVDAAGTVSTFMPSLNQPTHVAINTLHVVWADRDGLHAIPKAGGQAVLLDAPTSTVAGYEANAIAADQQFVFVAANGEVRRVPVQ